MGEVLLVLIAVVVVAGGVRLFRLRGGSGGEKGAVVGESLYLAGMWGFLAYADWLPGGRLILFALMSVIGALLLRVLLISAATGLPSLRPLRRAAPTPVVAAIYLTGLTLVIVVPAALSKPAPAPPTTAEAASKRFGGRIDKVVTLDAQDKAPAGQRVPVEQYGVEGKRLALVVAHHLQCVPEAVALSENGGTVTVTVVAKPAPRATQIFKDGRCAPDGPFTWRTLVYVHTSGPVTAVADAGAGGPASLVS